MVRYKDTRYFATFEGEVINGDTGRQLSKTKDAGGYFCVNLYDPAKHTVRVHKIIAECFLGESDLVVNHIDGNKQNNQPWNLEWCDNTTNQRHAHATGLKGYSGKQTDHRAMMAWNNELCEICIFRTTRECSRFLGVDNRMISYLVKTKRVTNGWYIDYLTDEEKTTFGLFEPNPQ